MSPRRRTDKLGPALDVELLLADLLAQAEAGNLPLATDDEARAWFAAWTREHPGHYVAAKASDGWMSGGQRWVHGPAPDWEDMPVGVARRDAIAYIEVILPRVPAAKRWRAERRTEQAWERAHPRPPVTHRGPSAEQLAWEAQGRAHLAGHAEAFDVIEAQAQIEAARTRAAVIRRFGLADLVRSPVARLLAQQEPPPPRPADAPTTPEEPASDERGDEEETP